MWLLANALGLAVGLEIAWLVDHLALDHFIGFVGFFSPDILGWLMVGLSIGCAQHYALKRLNYPLSPWWIFATMIALPAGIMLGGPLTFCTGLLVGGIGGQGSNDVGLGLALTGCMAGFVAAFIGGGIVGMVQSRLFLGKPAIFRNWVKNNMVGWAIAGGIFGATQLWFSVVNHLQWEENAVWLIILPPIGAIGGIISGKSTFSSIPTKTALSPELSNAIQK